MVRIRQKRVWDWKDPDVVHYEESKVCRTSHISIIGREAASDMLKPEGGRSKVRFS